MVKKYAKLLLAPAAVLILISILFFIYGLFPFGEKSLSWCDMNQQVIPLLLDFKDILSGKSGFFLSLQNAGGMNFFGVFLFFISSPFSFLAALVDKSDMWVFMNVLVALKMMVCAFTAQLFFTKKFKSLGTAAQSAFGVMYAFCGYAMLFFQNVVWLDMMYLFPLLLLSLDRLVLKQKTGCYIAALSAMIVVNFYLSYMVVLFILFAMGLYLLFFAPKVRRKKNAALLCVGSILSALISAAVWLPALFSYLSSARGVNLIENLAGGKFFTHLFTNLPLLFCTALPLAAVPFFLLQERAKAYPARRSMARYLGVLSILMLLPVVIEPINKMWHTGSYQAFPVRYGYMTVFVGLLVAALVLNRAMEDERAEKTNRWAGALIAGMLILIAGGGVWLLTNRGKEMGHYTATLWGDETSFIYLMLFFLACFVGYFLAVYLFQFKWVTKRVFLTVLCLLVVCESLFSGGVYFGSAARDAGGYRSITELSGKVEDDGFYRVKTERKYFDANLLGGLGYNNLGHYTSLISESYIFAMKKLGYSSYWMEVGTNGGTLWSDALLSNKYTITNGWETGFSDQSVYHNDRYNIVENLYCLPLGIKTSAPLGAELPDLDRIGLQEYLFKELTGSEETLFSEYLTEDTRNLSYQKDDRHHLRIGEQSAIATLTYTIEVQGRQTLYFDCFDSLSTRLKEAVNDAFSVTVNGSLLESSYPTQSHNGLLTLGSFEDETVTVELELRKDVDAKSFGVYGLHLDALERAVQSKPGVDMSVNRNVITGACKAAAGETLYLSLPYDKGYRVTINGEAADYRRVNDTFIAVSLVEGENSIALTYLPPGFVPGLMVTAIGALLTAAWLFWNKKHTLPRQSRIYTVSFAVFGGLAALAFLAVYICPVLIYWLL